MLAAAVELEGVGEGSGCLCFCEDNLSFKPEVPAAWAGGEAIVERSLWPDNQLIS